MGKYLASIAFIGGIAAAAPLSAAPAQEAEAATTTVAVQQVRVSPLGGIRDEAAMVLVGTALIGLAAAVRRSAA